MVALRIAIFPVSITTDNIFAICNILFALITQHLPVSPLIMSNQYHPSFKIIGTNFLNLLRIYGFTNFPTKCKKIKLINFYSFAVPTIIDWGFYTGRIRLQV
jgi:hypothetical protein